MVNERSGRAALAELVTSRSVLVCVGSGGVGKTSMAAALALEAARRGRRAIVVTIDPARRLADALGLERLGGEPLPITELIAASSGPRSGSSPTGSLHALMLDARATFDDLVTRHATDRAQAERILANRFYHSISTTLSGTQEYMAAEKLGELHTSGRFDLIVVDTPPTRQALDFLDAPGQLARFLDHPAYRLMNGSGSAVSRIAGAAGKRLLRAATRLVGSAALDDAVEFFRAFEGLEAGFLTRALAVRDLLVSAQTGFVVVTSARPEPIAEAGYFLERLAARDLPVDAIVANRMTPRFTRLTAAELRRIAAAQDAGGDQVLRTGLAELIELTATAEAEERALAPLHSGRAIQFQQVPFQQVPLLDHDVEDLGGLEQLRQSAFDD